MIAKLPITTKISAEMVDMIEAQAQAQGSTRSGIIIAAIEAWLGIEPSPTGTPASPGTLARLETLSGQLEALSARVGAIEASLAPTAPVAAPTAPPTAPIGPGLRINAACMAAGLVDRDWERNLSTIIKRKYKTSPDRALTARGWRKVKRLWYPPA
jgi:hypothetical protein